MKELVAAVSERKTFVMTMNAGANLNSQWTYTQGSGPRALRGKNEPLASRTLPFGEQVCPAFSDAFERDL